VRASGCLAAAGEIYTGERHWDAPPEAPVAWASVAAGGLLLSLPSFIKAPVDRTRPFFRGPVWPRVLKWSARPPAFSYSASGERGLPQLLIQVSSQRPFARRAHPSPPRAEANDGFRQLQ
jgi:hypothetical protein